MVDSGPVPPMRPRVFMEKRSLVIGHFPFELGRYSYLPCNGPWDLEMKNEKWKMTNDFPFAVPIVVEPYYSRHSPHTQALAFPSATYQTNRRCVQVARSDAMVVLSVKARESRLESAPSRSVSFDTSTRET